MSSIEGDTNLAFDLVCCRSWCNDAAETTEKYNMPCHEPTNKQLSELVIMKLLKRRWFANYMLHPLPQIYVNIFTSVLSTTLTCAYMFKFHLLHRCWAIQDYDY